MQSEESPHRWYTPLREFWHSRRRVILAALGVVVLTGGALAACRSSYEPPPEDPPTTESVDSIRSLAETYSPVLMLLGDGNACVPDSELEPYSPMDVNLLMSQPGVVVKSTGDDTILATTSSWATVVAAGKDSYIDFPGSHRNPGCALADQYLAFRGSGPAVTYARFVPAVDDRLAVQYYFFYYHNDWVNAHEGDWEMIQVTFDAASIEEAMAEGPDAVGYSSHGGGETHGWDSADLSKQGGHPLVFVATGSHANYFSSGRYIGVIRQGAGFGCEWTAGAPHREVAPSVVVIPPNYREEARFAWLLYEGLWGGDDWDQYSRGVHGPRHKDVWRDPFAWQDGLRSFSPKLPAMGGTLLIFDPVQTFCEVVSGGGHLMNDAFHAPVRSLIIVVLSLGGVAGFLFLNRDDTDEPRKPRGMAKLGRVAFHSYRSQFSLWLRIAAPPVLISAVLSVVGFAGVVNPGSFVERYLSTGLIPFFVMALQGIMLFSYIDYSATLILDGSSRGAVPDLRQIWGRIQDHFRHIFIGRLVASFGLPSLLLIAVLLQFSVGDAGSLLSTLLTVGIIIVAVLVYIQIADWIFVEQDCLLQEREESFWPWRHLVGSRDAVRDHEPRTWLFVGIGLVILFVPGLFIAALFVALAPQSLGPAVFILNAAVYSLVLAPMIGLVKALYYFDLIQRPAGDTGAAQTTYTKLRTKVGTTLGKARSQLPI